MSASITCFLAVCSEKEYTFTNIECETQAEHCLIHYSLQLAAF